MRLFYPAMQAQPEPYPSLLTALGEQLSPVTVVVLRGPAAALPAWQAAANALGRDDVLLLALPGSLSALPACLDKPWADQVTAHVCTGVKCLPPLVQIDGMLAVLNG